MCRTKESCGQLKTLMDVVRSEVRVVTLRQLASLYSLMSSVWCITFLHLA